MLHTRSEVSGLKRQVEESNSRASAFERQNDELIRVVNNLRDDIRRQDKKMSEQQRELTHYRSIVLQARRAMESPDKSGSKRSHGAMEDEVRVVPSSNHPVLSNTIRRVRDANLLAKNLLLQASPVLLHLPASQV